MSHEEPRDSAEYEEEEPDYDDDYLANPDDDAREYDFPKNPEEEKRNAAKKALDKFEEILSAAGEFDWETPGGRLQAFEDTYRENFDLVNETHGTLLHNFVTSRVKQKPLKLVKWFVKKWPELIKVEDADKKTALHHALDPRYNLLDFVDIVLEDFSKDDILATALGMQDHSGRNCLHHAIFQKFPSTLKLITKCGPETFTKYNVEGKTPLLMAMDLDYPLRRRAQLPRVQPQTVWKKNPTPQSASHREPPESQEKSNGYEVINADDVDNRGGKNAPGVKGALLLRGDPKGKELLLRSKDAMTKQGDPSARTNKPGPKDVSRPLPQGKKRPDAPRRASSSATTQARFYLPDVVQSLMNKSKESLSMVSKGSPAGQTPYQYRLYLLSKVNAAAAKDDVVAQDMKEFCLRELPRDDAIKTLYKEGKEKHIEFDLSSLPSSSISKDDLDRLARHLTFEDTLMYVALKKLRVEDSNRDNDHASPPALPDSITSNSDHQDKSAMSSPPDATKPAARERFGLTDANIVFQWLWDNGVRRIFKVIVIDDGEIPHSDQAIEEALKPFKIEIWDWKKIDICSETIVRAAEDHARIVYLYSSGNNAVLRGWSSESGLVKLKLLEEVHLIIRRGLETTTRRNQDVAEFEKAFRENWKKLYPTKNLPRMAVIRDDKPKSYASGFQFNKMPEQKQEWLSHMDIFATFVSDIDLKKERDRRDQERAQARLEGASHDQMPKQLKDVRVAVIDDGIDGFENDLSGSIAHGVSFCRSSDSENLIRTYYVSSGGHGTMMARLIRRMCPRVKLYVARLEEYRSSSGGKRFITARSAKDAVYWAITNKVHIISMSWSIEGVEEQDDIKEFKEAIEAAKRANITMFCAFSDQGNNSSEKTFPGAWRSECMTIGAATARGDASTFVDKNRVDFLFPGEQIVIDSKNPDPSMASSQPKVENGSSISTALAAGTAALLLFITQLVKPAFYQKLQEPGRMKMAFKTFCSETNPKYFKAQDYFDKSYETDPNWNWNIEGKNYVTILVNELMTKEERQSKDLN